MSAIDDYVEDHRERWIEELFVFLRQPSISAQRKGVPECAQLLKGILERVGIEARIIPMGPNDYPPLVYGKLTNPAAKRTLLIYGHFDVQPPEPLEAWDSPPFEPTIRDGRIYARGSGDNKGQLFAHIKATETVKAVHGSLPVNVVLLCDPEEEIGSPSLTPFVEKHQDLFRADFCYDADGSGHPSGRPILSFGNRGNLYVEVRARGANRDLHSGNFGGPVPNPAWRLVDFLATLRTKDGRCAVEGFYDAVVPPTPVEKEAIQGIPFDEGERLRDLGLERFTGKGALDFWERIMFLPTYTICGLASGYGSEGSKTVLPSRAKVKLDFRLVKNQEPMEIFEKLQRHILRHGFTDLEVQRFSAYKPSKTPIDHPMSRAVIAAARAGFDAEPIVYPLTGGSNPGAIFTDILQLPMIKIPYGNHDENNHAPNENLAIECFLKGVRTTAALFFEMAM